MDSEKPKFHTTKLLTTWWDLVDHYLLAVMFAVSVASVGLQTTQDRLICIPAVNCSHLTRNDSVVRKWSKLSDVLDICNRSPSFVFLTKMPDRRQYDYFDNECYKKMDGFSGYYSFIFLAETVLLLAISNFWLKYPNSASALAHCENLLSEFTKGDILVPTGTEGKEVPTGKEQQQQPEPQNGQQQQQEQKLLKRLKVFEQCYSQGITKFNRSTVTGQYRLRGVVGSLVTIILFGLNVGYYSCRTGWTPCDLQGHVAFSTEHRFFQCTRSMETYFHVGSILLIVLLGLHFFFVLWSSVWSLTSERSGPVYEITSKKSKPSTSDGDAATPSGRERSTEKRISLQSHGDAATPSGLDSSTAECIPLQSGGDAASPSGHESTPEERTLLTYSGDAAFLFHFIHRSNYSFLITVIRYLFEEEEKNESMKKKTKKKTNKENN